MAYFVAFYSYKGGVGRSLALANVAYALAARGKRVVMVDMDLEAPALHGFPEFALRGRAKKRGVVEYAAAYSERGRAPDIGRYVHACRESPGNGELFVMPGGLLDTGYQETLGRLNWRRLHPIHGTPPFVDALRKALISKLDPHYVLIDARTGFSDVGGLSTHLLADMVVVVFNLTLACLEGAVRAYRSFTSEESRIAAVQLVASPVPPVAADRESLVEKRLDSARELMPAGLAYGREIIQIHYDPAMALAEDLAVRRPTQLRAGPIYEELRESIQRANAEEVFPLVEVAQARRSEGRLEDGLKILRDFVATHPDNAEGHLELGEWLLEAGRAQEAAAVFQAAIALAPGLAVAHLHLGEALLRDHKPAAALPALETARAAGTTSYRLFEALAEAYGELGKVSEHRAARAEALAAILGDSLESHREADTHLPRLREQFRKILDRNPPYSGFRADAFWDLLMGSLSLAPDRKAGIARVLLGRELDVAQIKALVRSLEDEKNRWLESLGPAAGELMQRVAEAPVDFSDLDALMRLRRDDRADAALYLVASGHPDLDTQRQLELLQAAYAALATRETAGAEPILPLAEATAYEVSHAQRRLWILNQLEGAGAAYHLPSTWRLEGEIHAGALAAALTGVVGRHESLRTVFVSLGDRLGQRIDPLPSCPLLVVDATGLEDPETSEPDLIRQVVREPFDLERGPLLRLLLLRIDERHSLLALNLHEIIADPWSSMLFLRELFAIYDDLIHERAPSLPPLLIQYPDYAAWQNELLADESIAAARDYWHAQLTPKPAVLQLPADHARPPNKTYLSRVHRFRFDRETARDLQAFCARRGATVFMALLAVIKILLHRVTGQEDVVVGSPVAARGYPELESLIGNCMNLLILRDRVHGGMSFEELLVQIRRTTLGAYEHQDYPYDQLVDDLRPDRDASRLPLVDVAMTLLQDRDGFTFAGGTASPRVQDFGLSKFDLAFELESSPEDVTCSLVYNTALFQAERMAWMGRQIQLLVTSILADPGLPIARLRLLPDAELEQIEAWSSPLAADFQAGAEPRTLVEVFEQQVRRSPDAVAVSSQDEHLTYRQLDARADRLAHRLRALGVGPESRVGALVDRSPHLVVGLLGILKAGGAYVPLDPAWPAERLGFCLMDAAARVLVTSRSLAPSLDAWGDRPRIDLEDLEPSASDPAQALPPTSLDPGHLAYIIYTSGSTGRPKGVAVSHRNVTRLFAATERFFGFDEHDVWTLFHSFAFDFSVWEIFGALLYGGRLVIVPEATRRDPEAFTRLLIDEAVTVLNQTPAAFQQMLRAEPPAETHDFALRLVIFGGEALDPGRLRRWFERHGDRAPELVNMYGITETTVHVTQRPLRAADPAHSRSVIGVPLPDLAVRLLDPHLQPLPIGAVGEICVAGDGLARGYLGLPALTAERFVPDPLARTQGERLYRSGDLGRYGPDGDLEYAGRLDYQVKVRGFRIELGEIETALAQHPSVRAAVVALQPQSSSEAGAGDQRLVAYLVQDQLSRASAGELRRFLARQLPPYMTPSAYVNLEALPLTANGKVDRRRLPAPETLRPEIATPYVAPRNAVELRIAEIWQEVLEIERVGIDDLFFADLGMDSIMVVRAVSRLADSYGEDLSVIAAFNHPNVRSLAKHLVDSGVATASEAGEVHPATEEATPLES